MKNTTADSLSEAALKGDIKQIQTLLTKPLSSKSLHLALGHAAKNGDAQAVNLLLKAGAVGATVS